ncbi:13445_t:CDS:1, partial [Racocetra fulgida]
KEPKTIRYHANSANAEFSFIDIDFYPKIISQQSTVQAELIQSRIQPQ